MKIQELIEKYKLNFKSKVSLAVENSIELSDGTLMTSNGIDLAVGVSVFAVDGLENSTPINDGNYDLKDGTQFTIKDGQIETYGEYTPEVKVEDAIPVENSEDVIPEITVEDPIVEPNEIEELKSEIEQLKSEIKSIFEMLNMSGDAVVEMQKEFLKVNTTLSKIPADLGIQTKKVEKTNKESNQINDFFEKIKNTKISVK